MSDIDQQFIEYVVKSLVGKPDAVSIERRIDEKGVLLELTVDPEDLGRVIGKRGATAQSLRTLLRALGTKNDARYNLKIIDNGPLDHGQSPRDDVPATDKPEPADDKAAAADEPADDDNTETADEAVAEAPEETPPAAPEAEEPAEEEKPSRKDEDQTSDRLQRTRDELADLDDLDV